MDIQSLNSGIQSSEQYKIRKQSEAQQVQQAEQVQEQQALQQIQQQTDEYDKNNPVGEEVEGIYSVSHDEAGNLKVDYTQPAQKSEAKSSTDSAKNSEDAGASGQAHKSGAGAGAGATQATTSTESSSSDDDDEELKKLKEQRDILRQQLNKTTDEAAKAQLRTQLQSIETQIALKSASI